MIDHERIDDPDLKAAVDAALNDIARTDAPITRSTQCDARHRGHRCPATATKLVRMHRWGECEDPPDDAKDADRFDTSGNVVVTMCGPCAGYALQVAWQRARELAANIPPALHPVRCPTCLTPTTRGDDLCQIEDLP
jgi:hypothetical protein